LAQARQGTAARPAVAFHSCREDSIRVHIIRHAAADNPAVCLRLLQTCAKLAPQLHNDEQRQAILDQVEAVHEVARFRHVSLDTDAIEVAYRSARDQLISVWALEWRLERAIADEVIGKKVPALARRETDVSHAL